MRTLCVSLQLHMQTPEGIRNLNNLVEKLDVDLLKISIKHSTHKILRRNAFLKIGNKLDGTPHRLFGVAAQRYSIGCSRGVGRGYRPEFGGNVDKNTVAQFGR